MRKQLESSGPTEASLVVATPSTVVTVYPTLLPIIVPYTLVAAELWLLYTVILPVLEQPLIVQLMVLPDAGAVVLPTIPPKLCIEYPP